MEQGDVRDIGLMVLQELVKVYIVGIMLASENLAILTTDPKINLYHSVKATIERARRPF